jgi:hypothetical protein
MFNPKATIRKVPFGKTCCIVIDDALQDPVALREFAAQNRAEFKSASSNAYPGLQVGIRGAMENALGEFFDRTVRTMLGGRRREKMLCRLAMTTTPPEQLVPMQCIPHRDLLTIPKGQVALASVLYLFDDPALGGTSFYRPRQDAESTSTLVLDSVGLDMAAFTAKYGIAQGYSCGDSPWFERLASVPARFNRMLFYDSMVFHSGDITDPRALSDDPRLGRLTMNGFFTCTRQQA